MSLSTINPKLVSLDKFFSADKSMRLGLYVPAYQREFSWKKEHYVRLFNDVIDCMNQNVTENKVDNPHHHFLGSMIVYLDRDYQQIDPPSIGSGPEKVFNVVDGQQRLTSICLIAVSLHRFLSNHIQLLKDKYGSESDTYRMYINLRSNLECFFAVFIECGSGEGFSVSDLKPTPKNTAAPKIIRSGIDAWSTDDSQDYKSAIASYLSHYIKHVMKNQGGGDFKYEARDKEQKYLSSIVKLTIDKIIAAICNNDSHSLENFNLNELHPLNELYENGLVDNLFDDKDQASRFKDAYPPEDPNGLSSVSRALLLSQFIKNSLYVVSVKVCKDYNMAFSIFESLNSTGKPLNSYESFKPEVLRYIRVLESKNCYVIDKNNVKATLDKFEQHVRDSVSSLAQRDKAIKEIITIFSLVLRGNKLPASLPEQRSELRDRFFEMKDEDKHEFLKLLESVSIIYKIYSMPKKYQIRQILSGYYENINGDKEICQSSKESNFCINYLSATRCYMSLGIITRFFHNIRTCINDDARKIAVIDFCEVTKAAAAAHVLWRTSESGSTTIDTLFRNIFRDNKQSLPFIIMNKPSEIIWNTIDAGCIKSYIIQKLKSEFIKNDDVLPANIWTKSVVDTKLYQGSSKASAKMILLTGSHLSKVNLNDNKLEIARVNSGKATITEDGFTDVLYETIEHINPQANAADPELNDQLWNLTLLPKNANSLLGDRSVSIKKIIYSLFASETDDEYNELADTLPEEKLITTAKKIGKQINLFGSLPMLKVISMQITNSYNKNTAEQRTNTIVENCWKILAEDWLDWKSKSAVPTKQVKNDPTT